MFELETIAEYTGLSLWIIAVALIWSLIWKGFALWKAAKKKQPIWFVALLIFNTIGILEILYIFVFSEINLDGKKEIHNKKKTNSRKKSSKKSRR